MPFQPIPKKIWETIIYLTPVAKRRPVFTTVNGRPRGINKQETEEGRLLLELKAAWGSRPPIEGPVHLALKFGMPIPASTSQKRKRLMAGNIIKHTKRPDLDNLIKFIKDVANGSLWRDDCQVIEIHSLKVYADRPYTRITLMEIL